MKILKIIAALMATLLLFTICGCQELNKNETPTEPEEQAAEEQTTDKETVAEEDNTESDGEGMELIEKEIVIMGKIEGGFLVYVLPEAKQFHGLAIFTTREVEQLDSLEFGKIYKIEFNGAMTRSLPPQFVAETVKESDRKPEVLTFNYSDYILFKSFMGEQQLVDVRTDREYKSGHLENSINHSLGKIEEGEFGDFSKERPLLLYCRSGARSGEAAIFYVEEGFPVVVNLGGVIDFPQDKLVE